MQSRHDKQISSQDGFTLVEIMISTLIMGILLVSGLRLFGNLSRSSNALTDMDAANMLAVEMINEIKQQNYYDPQDGESSWGTQDDELGPDRTLYDDIDDYYNWNSEPPIDRNGDEYTQYPDFYRKVTVRLVQANNFKNEAIVNEGFKEVIITVSRYSKTLTEHTYIIADTTSLQRE